MTDRELSLRSAQGYWIMFSCGVFVMDHNGLFFAIFPQHTCSKRKHGGSLHPQPSIYISFLRVYDSLDSVRQTNTHTHTYYTPQTHHIHQTHTHTTCKFFEADFINSLVLYASAFYVKRTIQEI